MTSGGGCQNGHDKQYAVIAGPDQQSMPRELQQWFMRHGSPRVKPGAGSSVPGMTRRYTAPNCLSTGTNPPPV